MKINETALKTLLKVITMPEAEHQDCWHRLRWGDFPGFFIAVNTEEKAFFLGYERGQQCYFSYAGHSGGLVVHGRTDCIAVGVAAVKDIMKRRKKMKYEIKSVEKVKAGQTQLAQPQKDFLLNLAGYLDSDAVWPWQDLGCAVKLLTDLGVRFTVTQTLSSSLIGSPCILAYGNHYDTSTADMPMTICRIIINNLDVPAFNEWLSKQEA